MKKVMIWIMVALIYGLLTTALAASGVFPGGVLTVALVSACFFTARYLCKRLDKSSENQPSEEPSQPEVSEAPEAEAAQSEPEADSPQPEVPAAAIKQEEAYLAEASNGMLVRVPASKLDSWQAAQEENKQHPELTVEEQKLVDYIVQEIYGRANTAPPSEPPKPEPQPEPQPEAAKPEPPATRKERFHLGSASPLLLIAILLAVLIALAFRIGQLEDEVSQQEARILQQSEEYSSLLSDYIALDNSNQTMKDTLGENAKAIAQYRDSMVDVDAEAFADGYIVGYYRALRGESFVILYFSGAWEKVLIPSEFYAMNWASQDYFLTSIQSLRKEAVENS